MMTATASPAPAHLRVDGADASEAAQEAALHLAATRRPRLSWIVPLVRNGQTQTAYQIVASRRGDPRTAADAWDSGLVSSAANDGIRWGGAPLLPHERLRFAVRTADETGALSEWSELGVIEAGPFARGDWDAQWISFPVAHAASADVVLPAGARVERAVLHLAGHGSVRALVDGTVADPESGELIDTSLKRATVRSYDVTGLLSQGPRHRLSLVASLGHYRKVLTAPRLIAMLTVVFADGTTATYGTDETWTHLPTSVVRDEPFYIEEHDATIDDAWREPGRRGEPVTALVESAPGAEPPADGAPGVIAPRRGPSVRVARRVEGTLIGRPDGARVYDLGENVAGRSRIELPATRRGERITVVHGEKLDARGHVDTTNIRLPDDVERERQVVAWHGSGDADVVEPWFAMGGFRYIEVSGWSGEGEPVVSAGVMHSAARRTGWFSSSDAKLDALVDAAVRTQLNNTNGFPSDCPTREQAGWTGDAAVSAEAALSHLALEGMYLDWLADVALDMQADGGVRGVAPNLLGPREEQGADPVWGAALTEIPWQLWWSTGDADAVRPLLPAMRRWADWQLGTLEDGVVRHADLSYGADWLAFEQTPPVLLQTAAVARSLEQLGDLEETTGDADAAARRRAEADDVRTAARRLLRDPSTRSWGSGSQGSLAVALAAGLTPEEDRAHVGDRLRAAVAGRDGRLSTGFSATQSAVRALGDADGGTTLLRAVHEESQPGVGAMLVDGPGTFWETWWIDDENVGVASLDHIGLAAPFAAWAWTHVAGLRPLEPGFRRFAVEPRMLGEVSRVSVRRDTPRGRIAVEWQWEADELRARIEVPIGSACELTAPGVEMIELGPGRHDLVVAGVVPEPRREPEVEERRHTSRALWLSEGVDSTWTAEADGIRVDKVLDDFVCTPVYHEPMPAPSLLVSIDGFEPDREHVVRLEQDAPWDLTDASYVFASFDVDGPALPGRTVRPFVRLTSADGTSRTADVRPLPIAWNRVAVDVADWPGRSAVSSVELGVSWTDVHDTARGPFVPLSDEPAAFGFRVGRVGWTDEHRTY